MALGFGSEWAPFIGLIGLIALVYGGVAGLLAGFGSKLVLIHLVVGIAFLAIWFFTDGLTAFRKGDIGFGGRRSRYGFSVLLYGGIYMAIIVAVNWLASQKNYSFRWDLTKEKLNSLSPQTEKIISTLKGPVSIIAFLETTDIGKERDLLNLLKESSDNIELEFVDPLKNPHLVEKYGLKQGERLLVRYEIEDSRLREMKLEKIDEETIVNAILKLSRGVAKRLYYVVGHGEPGLDDRTGLGAKLFFDAVQNENLRLFPIVLSQYKEIPSDAAGVIIVSPKTKILSEEKQTLRNYLKSGGHLVLMLDPIYPKQERPLVSLAREFGVEFGNNIIIDKVQRPFYGPSLGMQLIINDFGAHPITSDFSKENAIVFNIASTVNVSKDVSELDKKKYTVLLKSSPHSWAESNLEAIFETNSPQADFNAYQDQQGPHPVGIAYEQILEGSGHGGEEQPKVGAGDPLFEKSIRIVAFSDSDWIRNAGFEVYSNKDLALNALNWIAGEEGGISIRPKVRSRSHLPISQETATLIFVGSMVLPEIFLIVGLAVWWRRRN